MRCPSRMSLLVFLLVFNIFVHGMIRENEECDFKKAVCYNECECGYGYYICNSTWVYRDIPESTVCIQDGNDVHLQLINYEYGVEKCGSKLRLCEKCSNGIKKCVDELTISAGYMECVNEKYIFREATDQLCRQGDNGQIYLIPRKEIHSTRSNVLNEGGPSLRECIEGDQRCLESCTCRAEYQICRGGEWYNFNLPAGHVCTQLKYGVQIIDIHDPGYFLDRCDNKLKFCDDDLTYQYNCHEGYTKCGDQCKCDDNYFVCEGNQWIEYTIDPPGVCIQSTPSNSTLILCDNPGLDIICPFRSDKLSRTNKMNYFDESSCIDGSEKCFEDNDILKGYKLCKQNNWNYVPISSDTICIQDGLKVLIKSISQDLPERHVNNNIKLPREGECINDINSDNTCIDDINEFNNNYGNVCLLLDGKYCVEECKLNSGYNICIDGNHQYHKLERNQVCWQVGPHNIQIVDSNSDRNGCQGRIH